MIPVPNPGLDPDSDPATAYRADIERRLVEPCFINRHGANKAF